MDRRSFIGICAAEVVCTSLGASAQSARVVRRIGVLSPDAPQPRADIQVEYDALRALGWVVGQNLLVERRYANGRVELLLPLAEELVRLKVEIIVAVGTAAALAAHNATTTIPIVIGVAGDPVRTGLVASLARPGGNITGTANVTAELDSKRLSMLRELLPSLKRLGVLENSTNPYFRATRKELEQTCQSLGLQPIIVEVAAASELESAIAELARRRAQALFVRGDGLFLDARVALMSASLSHALPTLAVGRAMLEAGALLSYDSTEEELFQRYAAFVDKILRGAKPADLPIEQPTKFDLSINLKAARALGVTVPQSLLLSADELIR